MTSYRAALDGTRGYDCPHPCGELCIIDTIGFEIQSVEKHSKEFILLDGHY